MKSIGRRIFFAIFIFAIVKVASSKVARHNRDAERSECGALKFRCANGDCIVAHLLCDGAVDCADRSDETREECTRPEIVCPESAFRCDYGACVDGDATCNGIDECADRSDELLPRCGNNSTAGITRTTCPSSQDFRCNDGRCIRSEAICDGKADCADSSDETAALCTGITCPAFRCNYGACIDNTLRCNGATDCVDGSDEDPNLCRSSTSPVKITTTSTMMPERVSSWRPPCRVPPKPVNGHWRLHRSQCPQSSGQHCEPSGTEFQPGTRLVYTCEGGYRLNGSRDVYCGPEGEWSSTPECIEIRCKQLSTASTMADCTIRNVWISCEQPVPPDTVAKLSCRNSYITDTSILSSRRTNVRCNERGQWEPEPIRCTPECGKITSIEVPLIVGGTLPPIAAFPWHATLYRSETPDDEKVFICGATIIQNNLLLTAAHCVYDEGVKTIEDPKKFSVATGNVFQDFNSNLHHPLLVKKARVKNIYVNCNYLGLEGNYERDIAILQIEEPFTFSAILRPVCLDVSSYSDQSVLEAGNYGRVAGFGKTAEGNTSQILQALDVPYVNPKDCKASNRDPGNEKFITIDKFCAGYRNGSSVCDGDSGGGLVFNTGGLWYLRGIVSVGIGAVFSGGTWSCDSYAYSLYTRISSHIEWIQDVMLKLEVYNTLEQCQGRRRNG